MPEGIVCFFTHIIRLRPRLLPISYRLHFRVEGIVELWRNTYGRKNADRISDKEQKDGKFLVSIADFGLMQFGFSNYKGHYHLEIQ